MRHAPDADGDLVRDATVRDRDDAVQCQETQRLVRIKHAVLELGPEPLKMPTAVEYISDYPRLALRRVASRFTLHRRVMVTTGEGDKELKSLKLETLLVICGCFRFMSVFLTDARLAFA